MRMKVLALLFLSILFCTEVGASEKAFYLPPIDIPSVQKTDDEIYAAAYANSKSCNKPLVIFVGTSSRPMPWAVTCQLKSVAGDAVPKIRVGLHEWNQSMLVLPVDVTDATIKLEISKKINRLASGKVGEASGLPFQRSIFIGSSTSQSGCSSGG